MMSVCLIGDSHIGALLLGWRTIRDEFPEVQITPFGAPRDLVGELNVSDGRLVCPDTRLRRHFARLSGGADAITGDYDRYLVCGVGWGIRFLLAAIGKFRSEDQVTDDRIPLSEDCYARAMAGLLRDSLSMQTVTKLRQITSRPIGVIPVPMPGEAARSPIYKRLCDSGDAQKIASHFMSAAMIVAKEAGAEFLQQPPETLSNPIQTLLFYKRDAVRLFVGNLDTEHGEKDYQHMNAAYGELVLRAAFSACRHLQRDT